MAAPAEVIATTLKPYGVSLSVFWLGDDKQSVEKMLAAKKSKLNGYRFLVVGEGIEKKSSDFAAEVMATAGAGR